MTSSSASNSAPSMRHRLNAADEELAEYFTSNDGVRAQSYEIFGTTTLDPHTPLIARLGRIGRVDAVARTLALVPQEAREVLVLVYGAGAGAFAEECIAGDVDGIAVALQPRRGFGSFLWLAARQTRTQSAFLRKGLPNEDVFSFLRREFKDGPKKTGSFFVALRSDCEAARKSALGVYEPLREARVKEEGEARREAKRLRDARGERLLAEELEIDARIRRARFERRIERLRRAS